MGDAKFDWKFYVNYYNDLQMTNIKTKKNAIRHWIKYGEKENRICNRNQVNDENNMKHFDWHFYITMYPDLKDSGIDDKKKAYAHWIKYGIRENRACNIEQVNKFVDNCYCKINSEYQKSISNSKIPEKKINILIRTSNRPEYFTRCMESILLQNYNNYNIIVCYDKIKSLEYIKNYNNITYFCVKVMSNKKYKFNLYCNNLLAWVKDGYILFIDDDNMFTHSEVFNIINRNIKNENTLLIWKFMRPDKLIFPKDINKINLGEIDTCSFCFHFKYKNMAIWGDEQCGDYYFLTELIDNVFFEKKNIDYILTKTQRNDKIGLFGH